MSNEVTARLTISAGLFIRGNIISEIKNKAFPLGISISVDEDKGLLESSYRIMLTGEKSKVDMLVHAIDVAANEHID